MDGDEKIMSGILFAFISLLVVFAVRPFRVLPGFSDGERTGEIYKFSYKGMINKSYEGEMYLGGFTHTDRGIVMDKFYFSIPKDKEDESKEIIEGIRECARERMLCTIEYSQSLARNPWTEDSPYIVTGVKRK